MSFKVNSSLFKVGQLIAKPTTSTMQQAREEVSMNQGPSPQGIRYSLIGKSKELNGRYRDKARARSWISKVKSAFLREQIPMKQNA